MDIFLKNIFRMPSCVASAQHILINAMNSGTESVLTKPTSMKEGVNILKEKNKNLQFYEEKR